MSERRVVVVGGGAAGMMAACQAAASGAQVELLEKTNRPGKKLRLSGKGRCNLTNVADLRTFIEHFGVTGPFLYGAFGRFFNEDLRAFFAARDVPTVLERGGRVFPASGDAHQVAEALLTELRHLGVCVRLRTAASRLVVDKNHVRGVHTDTGEEIVAGAVIVATGGASYPRTGSTGDGYRLAESVGHTVIPIRPALVPLVTAGALAARLQGLSLRNVEAHLLLEGREIGREFGEMLFTHDGVSGPIVLTLSGRAVDALGQGQLELSINLKPALTEEKLDRRLLRDLDQHGKRTLRTILKGLLPRKLVDPFVTIAGIPGDKPAHQITTDERAHIRTLLQHLRLTIVGHHPLAEAIITAGGVDTREIDPRTMESRLVHGLYFCGEVLDVQADTGGYNLQAAFSTGWLAGEAATRAIIGRQMIEC
ncbi:MAG: NAD(P)/FAD-dependent oxidoreductase [Chloroflexota bacterium]|nr:NAD(P)/FAD-dependent oxidoreductase [Chloroflexota bacterium]